MWSPERGAFRPTASRKCTNSARTKNKIRNLGHTRFLIFLYAFLSPKEIGDGFTMVNDLKGIKWQYLAFDWLCYHKP